MGCAPAPVTDPVGRRIPHQCPLDVCKLASIYADNCVCKLAVDDVTALKAEDACSSQGTPSGVGGAYNGMIKPLLNMTITGAIWYQGEANQDDPRDSVDNNGLPMASYGQCLCSTRGCSTKGRSTRAAPRRLP